MLSFKLVESPSAARQVSAESWKNIGKLTEKLHDIKPGFIPDRRKRKLVKLLHSSEFLLARRLATSDSRIVNIKPDEFPNEIDKMLSTVPTWGDEINPSATFVDAVELKQGRLFLAIFMLDQRLSNEKKVVVDGMEDLTGYSITLREPLVTIGEITNACSPTLVKNEANKLIKDLGITNIDLHAGKVINYLDYQD